MLLTEEYQSQAKPLNNMKELVDPSHDIADDSERNTLPNSCIHVHSPQGKLTALYETGTRFLEGR